MLVPVVLASVKGLETIVFDSVLRPSLSGGLREDKPSIHGIVKTGRRDSGEMVFLPKTRVTIIPVSDILSAGL